MKSYNLAALVLVLSVVVITGSAKASLIEPDYRPEQPAITTPWYEKYGLENFKANMEFIASMRPHHAGGLTMSQEYLQDEEKSSIRLQRLAKGIIDNQTFEIMMLDEVEKRITAIDFDKNPAPALRQVATQGLAQKQRFVRTAIPSLFDDSSASVTAEDVRFAKAMIIHHEGALVMCDAYLGDPFATNGYLERMCLDILRDQTQEIELMHDIIGQYDGDPDLIIIEPHMVHGMDGMMHHMMSGHH